MSLVRKEQMLYGGSTSKKNNTVLSNLASAISGAASSVNNALNSAKSNSSTSSNTQSGTIGASPNISYGPFSYGSYTESPEVTNARNAMNYHNANRIADWTGGTYGQALQDAMDRIINREKFSYDLNGDALYQQYKDQYINQGRLAMQDTIGQASALTGGYGNSYAATAGNQAYQGYLQGLNNMVPELYQIAYDKYNRDGEELYNQYGMYNDAYNDEYGKYRDKVADWNAEADRLSNAYYNAYNMDYGRYSDNYDRELNNYRQKVSENQFAQELALKQAQLNESIRSNLKNEEISGYKASKEGELSALQDKYNADIEALKKQYSGYMSPDIVKASNSQQVQTFNASVMTPNELARRGYATNVGGKNLRFDNYTQYVDAVLEDWYKNNKLTENETAYLKGQYGL